MISLRALAHPPCNAWLNGNLDRINQPSEANSPPGSHPWTRLWTGCSCVKSGFPWQIPSGTVVVHSPGSVISLLFSYLWLFGNWYIWSLFLSAHHCVVVWWRWMLSLRAGRKLHVTGVEFWCVLMCSDMGWSKARGVCEKNVIDDWSTAMEIIAEVYVDIEGPLCSKFPPSIWIGRVMRFMNLYILWRGMSRNDMTGNGIRECCEIV